MNGKGDSYRPVDKKKYDANYDRIFRKPKPASTKEKPNGGKRNRKK